MIRYYTKKQNSELIEINHPEKGCWINIYPPYNKEELIRVSQEMKIPFEFLDDSVDPDERARYDSEDGTQLVVVNVPVRYTQNEKNTAIYDTIPVGIIETTDYILTISSEKNLIIDVLLTRNIKHLSTTEHSHFVLVILHYNVTYFLRFLREIERERNAYEKELFNSSRNEELAKLMAMQKSLIYFVTSLRDNNTVMLRIQKNDFLKLKYKPETETEFFEDILIDLGQAQDMAKIYSDILAGTLNSFASIISNNLNNVMKRLTVLTVILMVPTLISSFFGMNVTPLVTPPAPPPYLNVSFTGILLFSFAFTAMIMWIFRRNKLI